MKTEASRCSKKELKKSGDGYDESIPLKEWKWINECKFLLEAKNVNENTEDTDIPITSKETQSKQSIPHGEGPSRNRVRPSTVFDKEHSSQLRGDESTVSSQSEGEDDKSTQQKNRSERKKHRKIQTTTIRDSSSLLKAYTEMPEARSPVVVKSSTSSFESCDNEPLFDVKPISPIKAPSEQPILTELPEIRNEPVAELSCPVKNPLQYSTPKNDSQSSSMTSTLLREPRPGPSTANSGRSFQSPLRCSTPNPDRISFSRSKVPVNETVEIWIESIENQFSFILRKQCEKQNLNKDNVAKFQNELFKFMLDFFK